MIQLSDRLSAVAEFVRAGDVLADIGTDHALLPTALMLRGTIPRAIAGDINPGPVEAAKRQVAGAGLTDRISVRMGDGLAVLAPGEADTVVIAGMGGGTMTDILASGKASLAGVKRLILQPNVGERIVREWLWREGWVLSAEQLLEEDGVLYEILVADALERSDSERSNDRLYAQPLPIVGNIPVSARLLMGPHLLARPTELFQRKWTAYVSKLEKLISQIEKSRQPEALRRKKELATERDEVKEVLSCLSTYKR